MITKAILPPRKGYVERVNPATGEHYYHKVNHEVGKIHKRIIIDSDQVFVRPEKSTNIIATLIGGGGSMNLRKAGQCGEIKSATLYIDYGKKYNIIIGKAGFDGSSGEPTVFDNKFAALGGQSGMDLTSKPLTVDGVEYGRGETEDLPATNGICIIEYDEVIYE